MENSVRLKKADKILILDLIGNEIDTVKFDLHIKNIKKYKHFKTLYVNLANLAEINNDTLQKLYKMKRILHDRNIALINVSAMQNCIFNIFNIDKIFQLYITKQDAIEGEKPIINRKFKIVS